MIVSWLCKLKEKPGFCLARIQDTGIFDDVTDVFLRRKPRSIIVAKLAVSAVVSRH